MTLVEMENLQIGDQIMFPNAAVAEVISNSPANMSVVLHMLSGTETIVPGDVPPEQQDVSTTCHCAWGDLVNAGKIVATKALPRKASKPPLV